MKGLKALTSRRNEKGLASIVIVSVLVVLLGLISIGFARLMDRAVQGSLNNQLSSSAAYATQSGVNDTIAYVQAQQKIGNQVSNTGCTDLFTVNGGADGKINPNFSTDLTLKYTCILINTRPPSLTFGPLPPSQSQVTRINTYLPNGTATPAASLLFSWQASDNSKIGLVPSASGTPLYNEVTWQSTNNYAPLLRLTLYPVPATGDLSSTQSSSRTYFLYPSQGGGTNNINYGTKPDGSLVSVNCSAQPSGFTGTYDKQCNIVISNLPSTAYFYARITPLYDSAIVKIKANDSSSAVLNFQSQQALIDVTAKSGTATKRLQATVSLVNSSDITPSEAALPEDGLRSAEAICKRLIVGATVQVDGTFCNNQLSVSQPSPPVVNFCVDDPAAGSDCSGSFPNSVTMNDGASTTLRWSISGADSCTTSNSPSWNGPSDNGSGSTSGSFSGGAVGGAGVTYNYSINCTNGGGSTPASVSIHVNPPAAGGGGGGGGPAAPTVFFFQWQLPTGGTTGEGNGFDVREDANTTNCTVVTDNKAGQRQDFVANGVDSVTAGDGGPGILQCSGPGGPWAYNDDGCYAFNINNSPPCSTTDPNPDATVCGSTGGLNHSDAAGAIIDANGVCIPYGVTGYSDGGDSPGGGAPGNNPYPNGLVCDNVPIAPNPWSHDSSLNCVPY